MGAHNLNTGTKRRTKLGIALEQSAREILAHVKGDARLPTRRIVLPGEVDVKRIRTKAGMSQAEFARAFCLNPRTLQEWEQGRRKPAATTRAYLAVIAKNPRRCWTPWRLELKGQRASKETPRPRPRPPYRRCRRATRPLLDSGAGSACPR